jgi:4-amino-4-deoxy-L-arabinose transferase-like glycosyltransferase
MRQAKKNLDFLISIFFCSFLLRIIAMFLIYNISFLFTGKGLFGDGWSYSENGYSILTLWSSGIRDMDIIVANMMKITTSGNLGSYDFWNAIVYYFTGKSPLSLIAINCLVSSVTVIFVYHITKQLYNERAAKISAILTAFWPSLFVWSIQNLKEPLSIFLIIILMWAVLQLKIKFRFYLLFLIILLSIALKELRMVSFFMFYIVILPISLTLSLWKRNKVLFVFLIASTGLIIFMIVNHYLMQFLPHNQSNFSLFEYIYKMRTYRAYGNTAFLSNLDISNPLNFIFFVPIALLVSWLAPFPWQVGSMSQITVIPEMLAYYALLPAMFLGWGFIMRYKIKEGGIIVLYIFIMMLVLAFVEGNIGTLFRHRAMVLPFMFILIGIGLSGYKNINKERLI